MSDAHACFLNDLLDVNSRVFAEVYVFVFHLDGWAAEGIAVDEDDLADFTGVKADSVSKICIYDVVKECQYHFRVVSLESLVFKHGYGDEWTEGTSVVSGAGHGVVHICNSYSLGEFINLRAS